MKKIFIKTSVFLMLLSILPLQSCIGSFSLTNRVIKWNNQVGSKFLNELVFFAFWILPVYEVTAVADLLVINSLEFWSGKNPVEAYQKTVTTDHGTYYITCNEKGYSIVTPEGNNIILEYSDSDATWQVGLKDNQLYPFMTMLDPSHVKMIMPDGSFQKFSTTEEGVMAYSEEISNFNTIGLNTSL